jgi:tetratricopeptide (TPR) repeat protein
MGLLHFEQGDTDEAIAWMMRAIELDPDNDDYYVLLGDFYGADRDIPHARRAWERALSLNRRNRQARARLSRLGD